MDPIRSSLFSRFSQSAWLIVVAAALLLLLACSNLATLLLARGRSRQHAAAVQAAIGAGARRLILVSVLEGVIICLAGAAVAIASVSVSTRAMLAVLPPVFARYATTVFDGRVLAVALAVAVCCAALSSVAPALRASRVDVLTLLQRSVGPTRPARFRGGRALLALGAAFGVAQNRGFVRCFLACSPAPLCCSEPSDCSPSRASRRPRGAPKWESA